MKRIMLQVAYDGTAYHGWQIQPEAITIESELNRAISQLTGEEVQVIGASRTDAGVHAFCNIAVFDTETRMVGEKFSYALNSKLPQDIRILMSKEVPLDFHPRKCETQKTYEYHIINAAFPNPLRRLYAHFTYIPLDMELMQKAASILIGEHDFKSFCAVASQAETTVRTIYSLTVFKVEDEITIRITGNGFLYNMVRIIAGTLMEVGRGAYPPERIAEILEAKERSQAGPTAPACGLTLIKYDFL